MIDKTTVENIVGQWLQDKDYFLVDAQVSQDDRIVVEIDHRDGVWIDDCADLSRFIESRLDRDEEDYELEVGSAGVGQPFKVRQQWVNNIGKPTEVLAADGRKLTGTLTAVGDDTFTLAVRVKKRLEGEKRPRMVDEEVVMAYADTKYAKYAF